MDNETHLPGHSRRPAPGAAAWPDGVPRRLLLVVTGLQWGGAESQVLDLAARFQARGWEVEVATLLKTLERRSVLDALGIPVHSLGLASGEADPRALARLVRVVRRFRPTVVHSHMVHANLLARAARLVAPMPVLISSAHNTNEGARWRSVAYRLTDRLTDLTTNVSEAAVARAVALKSSPAARIRYVPNGIDLERFKRDDATRARARDALGLGDRFAWLVVASFEPQKDYPNLLDAVARLRADGREPLVLAVGAGSRHGEVTALAAQAGLGEAVRFLGVRTDIPDLMKAADAYVMSSAWEGLPIVLLEAAASELPIVATAVGGNGQIAVPGETGFLVPPHDGEALAAAMQRVMDLAPEARRAMGNRAMERARLQFGIESVVDGWERTYAELLARAARPS